MSIGSRIVKHLSDRIDSVTSIEVRSSGFLPESPAIPLRVFNLECSKISSILTPQMHCALASE